MLQQINYLAIDRKLIVGVISMEREQLLDYLNATVTAGLGIAGVLTGGSALQAAAFLPAVAHALCTDLLPTAKTDREAVERELKALVKKACLSTQEILSKGSKERADFFQYANARIEMNMDVMPFADIINIIKRDLEVERKWQGAYITQIDIQEMTKLFVENFLAGLPEYPLLKHLFVVSSLLDHEQRLSNLEEKLTPALKGEPLPAAGGSSICSSMWKNILRRFSYTEDYHRTAPFLWKTSIHWQRLTVLGSGETQRKKLPMKISKMQSKSLLTVLPKSLVTGPLTSFFLKDRRQWGKVAWSRGCARITAGRMPSQKKLLGTGA